MDGGVASERCLFGAIVYEVAIVGKLMRDVKSDLLLRGLPTGNWSIHNMVCDVDVENVPLERRLGKLITSFDSHFNLA